MALETLENRKFLNSVGVGRLWEKIRDRYDSKLDNVVAADASVTVTDNNKVGVQISAEEGNLLQLKTTGNKGLYVATLSADTYAITSEESDTYAAVYRLKKYAGGVGEGVDVGVPINIPKDMVVQSGIVTEKNTDGAWGAPGTYIELTLANSDNTKLWIPVGSLIEYVTSGSKAGDMVFVTVDPTTHQVTATITDGTITKAKLDTDLQASIGRADSAVQEITTGTTNGTIKVDGDDVAVFGLGTAAYANTTAFDAAGAADAVLGTETDTAATATVYGAKKYASDAYAAIQALTNTEIDSVIAEANATVDGN